MRVEESHQVTQHFREIKETGMFSVQKIKNCSWKSTVEVQIGDFWVDVMFSANAADEEAICLSRYLKVTTIESNRSGSSMSRNAR